MLFLNGVPDSAIKQTLLLWLPPAPVVDQSMDVDHAPTPANKPAQAEPVPEVEIYLRLLILHHLHTSQSTYAKSMEFAHETIHKIQSLNRRSMDPLAAKIWFAVERTYELAGELADARPSVPLMLPYSPMLTLSPPIS